MTIYAFLGPDNQVHHVAAADQKSAQSLFDNLIKTSPEMFAQPGVRAAMKAKLASTANLPKPNMLDNITDRATSAATLGLSNQMGPVIDAAGTAIRNAVGAGPGYSAKDAYDAARLLQSKQLQAFQGAHPIIAGASDVAGSMAMPGGDLIGKYILGSAAPALAAAGKAIPMGVRAAQVARAAPVVAGLGATQGALTAQPGQEGIDAARAAASSVAAAPLIWAGTGAVSKGAPLITNAVSKLANSDIATNAMTKLANALKSAKLSPDDLQKAMDDMSANGAVTPTLVDILQKAGAGPKVMRLVQTAGSSPSAIRTAQGYADHTQANMPSAVANHINATLDTSAIPQSVPQLRAANDAAIQTAQTPMTTGVAPEEGGEAVSDDLNNAYDASRKTYQDAFKVVDAAHPESAVVADDQRAPLVTDVMSQVSPHLGEDWPSSNKLLTKLDSLKQGMVTDPTQPVLPDLPPDAQAMVDRQAARNPAVSQAYEAKIRQGLGLDQPIAPADQTPDLSQSAPLTVRRLRDLDRWTGSQVSKLGSDNPEAVQFIVAQNALRDNLASLSDNGHIEGDPDVVNALNTAIGAYAQHKATFGSGLPSDLTERTSLKDDQPIVPSYAASEHIFGSGDNVRPLTNLVPDLRDISKIVSPEAFSNLQGEAAARYSPQDMLAYAKAHPTAGETIFSPETRTAAQSAVDNATQAQASNAALDTGSGVLSTPPVEFSASVDGHAPEVLPHAQVAAKQALLDKVQSGGLPDYDPNSVGVINLGKLFDPDTATAYGGGLQDIADQASNAANLSKSLTAGADNSKSFADLMAGRHIDTPHGAVRRGLAERYNKAIGSKLTPDEGDALTDNLVSDANVSLPTLQAIMSKPDSGLISPSVDSTLTPLLTKSTVTAPDSNAAAMQDLKTRYGLDLPLDAPSS